MDHEWEPIEPSKWQQVPCICDRVAVEADVREGSAVFFVPVRDDIAPPAVHPLPLPSCGWLANEDGSRTPVVVIQAEVVNDAVAVGYRPLSGGNGVCTLGELELMEAPSSEFLSAPAG